MHLEQFVVTAAGFAAIGWVLWYFLVPARRGAPPRPPRDGA
ncbi:MAG: hypothetical protein ABSB58_03570 [Gemmatimonadales bacterium]|jgi:hypothetical protein